MALNDIQSQKDQIDKEALQEKEEIAQKEIDRIRDEAEDKVSEIEQATEEDQVS